MTFRYVTATPRHPILFDDGPADLVRLCDALQVAALAERYRNSPHGLRQSRLRALQQAVNTQLQRTQQETPR